MSPSSHAFSMISCGHVPSRSYSHATGRISFSAKSCAISRSAFCSSVRVKSTTAVSPCASGAIDWSVKRGASAKLTPSRLVDPSAREDARDDGDAGHDGEHRDDHERPLLAEDGGPSGREGPAPQASPHARETLGMAD